ncbi:T9SS type A sorting domain-containing protein [Winogradskyella sp. SYSU M77433]|uniref:T9SS type A sorting domain-containing protein n=1 Tax=Winogradskyella sp. SYSU M77433 TaxID=3042722 RepID=UPI002481641B|nr:T9SS type A sorting domain-containing protein [Winogradskyella sp. SYSU M77433]MDH7911663.1 T9SS type A sorting domain-containing protein [Winogradskyella sp. SYSU M77433]
MYKKITSLIALLLTNLLAFSQANLEITEIWPGNDPGTNLTSDWFEITNTGTTAWISGTDGDLYYDDDSQDPSAADIINGIVDIQPNERVIIIVGDLTDVDQFNTIWSPAYDLTNIEIGFTDGSGLGQGGDGVTLWIGDPNTTGTLSDFETYPDASATGGQSYDVELAAFSTVGNTNNAGATFALNDENQPAIASPGNQGPLAPVADLHITEMWPGNDPGDNLSSDWFEIVNNGSAAWVSGVDEALYYDDDSQDPTAADIINGITDIQPGERVIIIIGEATDITEFNTLWSADYNLSGIEIGYTDGSGLGGGGDAVTLWIGDPNTTGVLSDFESYPDTALNGGQSYDVELAAFSTVLNASNAAATSTLNDQNQPAIASPGNQGPLVLPIDIQVTEIWSGQAGTDLTGDWFEIYNAGTQAWVASTSPELWYDDESASPSDATLIEGITELQPGESAIVMIGDSSDATEFYTVWSPDYNLSNIEIGYTDGAGLGGGGDTVTLWLGNPQASGLLLDSGSYPDTASDDGKSYDIVNAAFSVTGSGSVAPGTNIATATTILGGDLSDTPAVGSPGNQGPTVSTPGAPDIIVDITSLSTYLSLSEQGPSSVSGVVNDPTDPASITGIPFTISDAETALSNLVVTVSSSDETVVPNSNLVLTGTGGDRLLTITPIALGFSTITITVEDADTNTDTYTINYAASEASVNPSTSRFHTGASDGSTAIPVDSDYMWVGDDEDQTLRLYDRNNSGLPLTEINFNGDLGSTEEIDIEGSIRTGNTLFWIGSTATADRSVMFSTTISGSSDASTLTYGDKYTGLRDDLLNGGFGLPSNIEIEALAFAPNSTTAYLGFRVPDIGDDAVIIPVTNFTSLPGSTTGSASFDAPIYLDLDGRTLRSMECNSNGCILLAGPNGTATDFALYTWSGNSTDNPELRSVDLWALNTDGAFEGIVEIPSTAFMGSAGDALQIQLMSDLGATIIYNDGNENKDQRREWKKFRTDIVTLGSVVVPTTSDPLINEFVADHTGTDTDTFIEILGDANTDYSNFTLLEIEGDSGSTTGFIDAAINLGTTDSNGYWLDYEDMENGTITLLLVEGFTGAVGDDIDTNDDGIIDNAPWTRIVDDVATSDGGASDFVYSLVDLAPNYDGDANQPGGASRIPNGTDTDTTSDWVRNDYDGAGLPALNPGTPEVGEALNTPGAANEIVLPPMANLQITEIWAGNEPGSNLTADWFEITNTGTIAWTPASGELYYDDESQDPASAAIISGITSVQPGEVVVVVDDVDSSEFLSVWAPSYNLSGIQIGTYAGAGLGQGGDGVTLWIGDPITTGVLADFETYPDANANGGQSYDVDLMAFSVVGNANNAGETSALNDAMQPAIGSPGNQGPTLGINDHDLSSLNTKLYPLPFNNEINISTDLNQSMDITIKIINILGSEVYSDVRLLTNGTTSINDLSQLSSGVYILRIPELNMTTRILKK